MPLEPYTNTYTDVDGSIADADDILEEYDRIELFIGDWLASIEKIGDTIVNEYEIEIDGDFDIDPALGLIQKVIVDLVVEEFNLNILPKGDTDPHRIYLTLRFRSPSTTYTISAPSGSHLFGVNRTIYSPSQVIVDGFYASFVMITYGSVGTMVKVFADNTEETAVAGDDILQSVVL